MARRPLRVGSTFSGVGGADIGLERAGFELAWTCEFDDWKRSVLAAHWPNIPHYRDVRDIANAVSSVRHPAGANGVHAQSGRRSRPASSDTGAVLAQLDESGQQSEPQFASAPSLGVSDLRVDLLCGGFPCQDLSVAGKRRGFDGERSVLAFEFLRIAESIRPRWLLLENVPGLLSSNSGRDMARLLDELGAIGYGWCYRLLNAQYFGVAQRRRRIFIVARSTDAEHDPRAAARLALRAIWEGRGGDPTPGWPPRALTATGAGNGPAGIGGVNGVMGDVAHALTAGGHDASEDGTGRGTPIIAGALTKRYGKGVNTTCDDGAMVVVNALDRQAGGPDDNSAQAGHLQIGNMGVRRLTPTETERLMGWPDGWTAPPGVKAPDSKRYAACGDGIVSWVAYWIGCRIRMIEDEQRAAA